MPVSIDVCQYKEVPSRSISVTQNIHNLYVLENIVLALSKYTYFVHQHTPTRIQRQNCPYTRHEGI